MKAKVMSDNVPGMTHRTLLPSRNHAQKAKHPPISPIAASEYNKNEFTDSLPP
jgi:hypothetical protein